MAATIGTVSRLVGKVYARAEDGTLRELRLGDAVFQGETLVTTDGSVVEIAAPDAPPILMSGGREMLLTGELATATRDTAADAAVTEETLDTVIAALESGGDILDAVAAPAAGGPGDNDGSSFIRLGRIGLDLSDPQSPELVALASLSSPDTAAADNDLQLLANEAPTAQDDGFSGAFATPIVGDLLANDNDPDGDALTVIDSTQPANGVVVVSPDGTFTYTPNDGFSGTDSFEYTVDDGNGGTDTAQVTLTVGDAPPPPPPPPPSNNAPDAVDDAFSGDFGEVLSGEVLGNDSDPDGDTIVVTGNTQPSNGAVVVNPDGTFTYTPNTGFSGNDSFTYTIDDGQGGSDQATVVITVGDAPPPPPPPVNAAPTAVDDAFAGDFGESLSGEVLGNDSDPDGDALLVTGNTAPSNGTVVVNADGTFTYTPNTGFSGNDSFTYTIDDGQGGTDTATVTITVGEAPPPPPPLGNNDPDAVNDSFNTAFGEPVAGQVLTNDSDPDGDSLTVTGNSLPANGSLVINADGTFTYTPDPGFSGQDSFSYLVSDGQGGADTATVIINVAPDPNGPPVAVDDAFSTPFGLSVVGSVLGNDSDPEGDSLAVVANTNPANGTVSIGAGGNFVYTPNDGFFGQDSFTYTINDGNGGTATATVTIAVDESITRPTNNFPDAIDDQYTTPFGESISGTVTLNDSDPDGDPLTVISNTQPANGTLLINADGSFSYLPNAGFSGEDTFSYTVADGQGGTDTATVSITVEPDTNVPPVAADDSATVEINQSVIIGVLANDADSDGAIDPTSLQVVTGPADGEVTVNADGTVTYTPLNGFSGEDSFTYTVVDNNGAVSNTATVTIAVRDFGAFSVADVEVIEGGIAQITVTRSGDALDEAQVSIATVIPGVGDTAVAGDFVAGSQVLTFAPGVTSMTFAVATVDDSLIENPETFRVTLSNPTGGAVVDAITGTATVTILDNDGASVVIGNAQTEEGSSAVFGVTLTGESAVPVDIRFTAGLQGSNTAELADFDAAALTVSYDNGGTRETLAVNPDGTVTVPAGVTELQVSVPTVDDDVFEGPETFTLSASSPDNAYNTNDTGTGTVIDDGSAPDGDDDNDTPDDDRPLFSINDVTVDESAGEITFTVTKAGSSELAASVQYSVGEGSALEPEDYSAGPSALNGVLVFAPGVTEQTITLTVNDDALAEGAEQFQVTLSNAVNGIIDDEVGIGTINDEATPDTAFTLQLFAVVDGEYVDSSRIAEDGGIASYVVMAVDELGEPLASQPGGAISVSVGDSTDTATRGADYTASAVIQATVGLPFTVTAIDDALADNNEAFTLALNEDWSRAGEFESVSYVAGAVTTTIIDETDNDPEVPEDNDVAFTLFVVAADAAGNPLTDDNGNLRFANAMQEEGETSAYYLVIALGDDGEPLAVQPGGTVDVVFTNTTASDGDYTRPATTTVTVGQVFSAAAVDDVLADDGEVFVVGLASNPNYSAASEYEAVFYSTGVVTTTIGDETGNDPQVPEDNDTALVSISGEYVIEEGDTSGLFTVSVDQPAADVTNPITVNLVYSGVAVDGTDYTGVAAVVIPAGSNSVTFSLQTLDDALAEGSESLTITLGTIVDANFEAIAANPAAASVTNAIVDEAAPDTGLTLQLFAVIDGPEGPSYAAANTMSEDNGAGSYIVLATDGAGNPLPMASQPGGQVTVNVGVGADTADRGVDYQSAAAVVATVGVVFQIAAIDDVYADSGETFTLSLVDDWSGAAAFEAVAYADSDVVTTLVDDADVTTVSLSSDGVNEGEPITVTATVDNAPLETDLVVTLTNGEVITIAAGELSGSVTFPNPNGADDFVDAEVLIFGIASATGGNFEALDTDGTVEVSVGDAPLGGAVLTLENLAIVEADSGTTTINGSLSAAPQTPITVTLDNGATLFFDVGQTAATSTPFAINNDEDVYRDGSQFTVSVTGVSGDGNFESLDVSGTATVTVSDTIDTVPIHLSASDVDEGGLVTITATLSDPPIDGPLRLNLSNGATLFIPQGSTTGSVTVQVGTDDAWINESLETVRITIIRGGEEFENLVPGDPAVFTVRDNDTVTTLSLEASAFVAGEPLTITARVDNAPQTDLRVTLDNGEAITIIAGQTSGSVTFTAPDVGGLDLVVSATEGGNYEVLDAAATLALRIATPPTAQEESLIQSVAEASLVTPDTTNNPSLGTLEFTAGNAPIVDFAFAADLSQLVSDTDPNSAGNELTWVRVSDVQIVGYLDHGTADQAPAVELNLLNADPANGRVDVAMTVLAPFKDAYGDDIETDLSLGWINVVATDEAGLSASGKVQINSLDDVPVVTGDIVPVGTSGMISVTGDWGSPGADGVTAISVTSAVTALQVGGALITFDTAAAETLIGAEGNFQGTRLVSTAPGDNSATLVLFADGTYSLDVETFDTTTTLDLFDVPAPSGPKPALYFDGTAWSDTAPAGPALASMTGSGGVNISGQGIGVDNNLLNYSTTPADVESLTLTFAPGTTGMSFAISDADIGEGATVLVRYHNGDVGALDTFVNGDADWNGGLYAVTDARGIAEVTITAVGTANNDKVRIDGLSASITTPADDLTFRFDFTVTDADGDTHSGSIASGVAPIALDMNGDGVDYLGLDAGVVFTDQTTGESMNTAWVGPEDGMLVFDANRSGTVDATEEFVFTEWSETAATDMEALAEVFDTNQDGVLDASDAQWDQFAVWTDSDSDGTTDSGELVSLGELGIESIALTYREDSESGTAAEGDVVIYGQSEVTWQDGSTSTAEDAAFAIAAADVIVDSDDMMLPAAETDSSTAASGPVSAEAQSPGPDLDAIEMDILLTSHQPKFDTGVDE